MASIDVNLLCNEQEHPAITQELDLVEEEDQITHLLQLEEAANAEEILSKSKRKPQKLHQILELPVALVTSLESLVAQW